MKLKIDQPIRDLTGKPLELVDTGDDGKGREKIPFTYRMAMENAMNATVDGHPLSAEKKLTAFQIGVKINAKKLMEYDLTVDQVAFVKERVGAVYGPVVYGRFLELIGDEAVKPEKE